MYVVMFFDIDIGEMRKIYASDLHSVFKVLELCNVDYVDHFVKVRYKE